MKDKDKTKAQLIAELERLRPRVSELEHYEIEWAQAENTLRDSEKRFRDLADMMPEAIFETDNNLGLTYANQRAIELFGYTPEELPEVLNGFELLTPEERVRAGENLVKRINGDDIGTTEYQALRKDGTTFPMLFHINIMMKDDEFLGVQGIVIDLTESKRAEEELLRQIQVQVALREAGAAISSTLDLETVLTRIAEEMGRAVDATSAYINSYEPTIMTSSVLAEYIGPGANNAERVSDLGTVYSEDGEEGFLEKMLSGNYDITFKDSSDLTEYDRMVMRSEGVKTILYIPLRIRGQLIGYSELWETRRHRDFSLDEITLCQDMAQQAAIAIENARLHEQVIRDANELEKRVRQRTKELQATQEKLIRQERLAVLGQMAGGVSHELRNPLGVISNAIYYLNMVLPDAEEQVKEHLELIRANTQEANRIISDLLDFARVKSINRIPANVYAMVAEVLTQHSSPENVFIHVDIPEDLPHVYVDSHQISQVLVNLVTNAYQAMPDGGKLTIENYESLTDNSDTPMIALCIRDTGSGILPENMDKIFEPLFTTKARGIGLGLAISKKLVEANEGKIEVESTLGKGSTFTIYLPVNTNEI